MDKTKYFLMAYDVPLKEQPLPGIMNLCHEEEYGYFNSLDKALKKAKSLSKSMPHPIHLFYVSEYIYVDEEDYYLNISKSVEEWLE